VTQGTDSMELSLFSRDTIAMATAVALSHNMFDAALMLGICDKIVPGLFIGAAAFGHLPILFVPGGPMASGIPNPEKARVRNLYAEGRATREQLLVAESASYHDAGTCTFYGTANSNQMLMEVMGLHLPGAAFVPPNTPLRDALTIEATRRAAALSAPAGGTASFASIIDERSIVNAMVGLMATGGSTNHTIHLVAMAHAAGISINWDDFSELSSVVPLLARIYPNGKADVNHFHAAGGMGFLVRELLQSGLLHEDVTTVAGQGLLAYSREPWLGDTGLGWRDAPAHSRDTDVLRPASAPFSFDGGIKLLKGNLGRSIIKVSAVKPEHQLVEAPAMVFTTQQQVLDAFRDHKLSRDVIVVLREQGPRANGMPELHKLTPALSVLQGRGHHVALVTDGRMSGASGTVPAAIHVSPESVCGGPLARVRDGDILRLDARSGRLDALVDPAEFAGRPEALFTPQRACGSGRELFSAFRAHATDAESGARTCNS
jgi:phosphogluconate dehydratase